MVIPLNFFYLDFLILGLTLAINKLYSFSLLDLLIARNVRTICM